MALYTNHAAAIRYFAFSSAGDWILRSVPAIGVQQEISLPCSVLAPRQVSRALVYSQLVHGIRGLCRQRPRTRRLLRHWLVINMPPIPRLSPCLLSVVQFSASVTPLTAALRAAPDCSTEISVLHD